MRAPARPPALQAVVLAALILAGVAGDVRAYTPGSGTLMTDAFQDGDDAGWGRVANLSKWTVADRGGSKAYLADGQAELFRGLPETSRRPFIAVPVGSFEACLSLNAAGTAGSSFSLEARPPREDQPFYRLLVEADGHADLLLVDAAGTTTLASSPPGLVPAGTRCWLRLALAPAAGGATEVKLRVWQGGATAEPATWDLVATTPGPDSIPYIQRLDVSAVLPAGSETWIDQVDLFGDTSAGVLSSIKTVWIVEASHLDIGFTEPPDDIEAFAKSHLDQVLANLRSDPGYRWTIESSWWLARFLERSTDAEKRELFDFARAGRISLAAGYVNLHTTLATQEELIRSLSFSQAVERAEGIPVRTWIQDDVPGATWALPELLAKSGVPYYLGGMNCVFGGAIDHPMHAERPFWWEGPDGSRVLAWITFDSYAEGLGLYGMSFFDNLARLHDGLGAGLGEQEGLGYPHENLLVMRAFDNHYQGLFVKNLVDQWNATYATPRLRLASPEEFLDAVQQEIAAAGRSIPVFRGDFGTPWADGVHTPHTAATAHAARRDLEAAETFTAAASLSGTPHPSEGIDLAWRRILEVDEHSGGGLPWPGYMTPEETARQSAIHEGYAREAAAEASAALSAGLGALSQRLDLPRGGVVVWNALDAPSSDLVRVTWPDPREPGFFRLIDASTGEEVPYRVVAPGGDAIEFVATAVPARGYKAYETVFGPPSDLGAGGLVVTGTTIENGFYRVTVDPADGSVTSIVELATRRELVDPGSGFRFGQTASNLNADRFWGVRPTPDASNAATVTVEDLSPTTVALVAERFPTPAHRMRVALHRGLDAVEIEVDLDGALMPHVPFADHSRTYAVTLPLVPGPFAFGTESPGGWLRPDIDGFERSGTWAALNSEGAIAVEDAASTIVLAAPGSPVSEWGGISNLVPQHRTDRATWFLRVVAKADEAQWADGTTGACDPEPGFPDAWSARILLRALPAASEDAAVRRAGFDLTRGLSAVRVGPSRGPLPRGGRSLFSIDDPDARLAMLKRAEDGRLVARVEEMQGTAREVRLRSVFTLADPRGATPQDEPLLPLAADAAGVVVPVTPRGTASVTVSATDAVGEPLLRVAKDERANLVKLSWTGGVPAFRVLRSPSARLDAGTVVAGADLLLPSLDDAGLIGDRVLWYYDVR